MNATWVEVQTIQPLSQAGKGKKASFYAPRRDANRHFRSVIYPRRVRMEDGRIWRANTDSVRAKVKQVIQTPNLELPSDTSTVLPSKEI